MQSINVPQEVKRISTFLKDTFKKTKKKNIIIGWSGGIDSTVCLYLLIRALPKKNIHVLHLPYFASLINELTNSQINELLKNENIHEISIKKLVDQIWTNIKKIPRLTTFARDDKERYRVDKRDWEDDRVRLGNIMARVRMILLFDYAKRINGLVCGTENKTEHLLGYFTRFGDAASDIEPIMHLYKTQVYEMARFLKVPRLFIDRPPSADLWNNQTDEGEFGFSYEEADRVLRGNVKGINEQTVNKVHARVKANSFKHNVPFTLV